MLHLALALFLASPPAPEPAYFRIELSPSGSQVSIGEPVVKGGTVLFHAYPDGRLMSLRRSDIRSTTRITAKDATGPNKTDAKPIANLAMQGGSAPGAPAGAARSAASGGPALTRPIAQANSAAAASGPQVVPVADGVAVTTSSPNPR